jgi:hypothetical protein
MAKKKRPPEWPPDIFWISPEGKVKGVIGHVTALQARPEAYGLPDPPIGAGAIDRALDDLFEAGWVRGRFSQGTFSFQMERPRGLPMGNAYAMVLLYRDEAKTVQVDFWLAAFSRFGKDLAAADFLAQRFPAHWGLGGGASAQSVGKAT